MSRGRTLSTKAESKTPHGRSLPIKDESNELNEFSKLFIGMLGKSCSHNPRSQLDHILTQLRKGGEEFLKKLEQEKIKKISYPFINLMDQLCPKDYVEATLQQKLNELELDELLKIRWITVSNKTLRWVSAKTYQWMMENNKNVITNEKLTDNDKKNLNKLEEVKQMMIAELKKSVDQETLGKKIQEKLDSLDIITEFKTEAKLAGISYYKLCSDPDGKQYLLINGKKQYLT